MLYCDKQVGCAYNQVLTLAIKHGDGHPPLIVLIFSSCKPPFVVGFPAHVWHSHCWFLYCSDYIPLNPTKKPYKIPWKISLNPISSYLETQGALKKMSSNESRWRWVFSPAIFAVLARTLYKSILGVVRLFSGVALSFWATCWLPFDFSQSEKMKKMGKTSEECRIFPYAARVSAFTRCSVRRKQLDFGMLADAGRQFSNVHHHLGWSPKSMVFVARDDFWLQKPKVDSFRKGDKKSEQLWGSRY